MERYYTAAQIGEILGGKSPTSTRPRRKIPEPQPLKA